MSEKYKHTWTKKLCMKSLTTIAHGIIIKLTMRYKCETISEKRNWSNIIHSNHEANKKIVNHNVFIRWCFNCASFCFVHLIRWILPHNIHSLARTHIAQFHLLKWIDSFCTSCNQIEISEQCDYEMRNWCCRQ